MEHKSINLDRIWQASSGKVAFLRSKLEQIGLDWANFEMYIQCFKWEKSLLVWVRGGTDQPFCLLRSCSICAMSGDLGPKRREGDLQVPEGIYFIDRFNPHSKFHLSLGLNYPNEVDLALGDALLPGSDIFIHGGCQSAGCVSLTNEDIEELYTLADQVTMLGQQEIRVDIFPFVFGRNWDDVRPREMSMHGKLWRQLTVIFNDFEQSRTLRSVHLSDDGYRF